MKIRKSTQNDVEEILHLFDFARAYMAAHGNATQWIDGYPGRDLLLQDIANGDSYVMLDGGNMASGSAEQSTCRAVRSGWPLTI